MLPDAGQNVMTHINYGLNGIRDTLLHFPQAKLFN